MIIEGIPSPWCVRLLLAVSFSAFALSPAFADLGVSTPESEGVPSEAILKWIDACETNLDALHGFTIVRHGKVIAAGSWAPYAGHVPHQLWSHSKGFTSAAVGLLADDGLVDIDERVADIFPDCLPPNPSARLLSVRVRDLLTMNYGCDRDHQLRAGGDWVRQTLAKELVRDPGSGFRYDSDCTYLLAAIVERKSGRKMMDLLEERLFRPMGIANVRTGVSPQGIPCGGWGMFMRTHDLAKYGQLFLQNGCWEGRQLLSTNWVRLATADHTSCGWGGKNALNGGDWNSGYGFQFWRCTHGAYRNDGANGQYTVVMPEQDAVVSITAGLDDMGKELNLVWSELLASFAASALPENKEAVKRLKARLGALKLKTVGGSEKGGERVLGRTYALDKNSHGIRSVRVDRSCEGWVCTMQTAVGVQHFPIDFGKWRHWRLMLSKQRYENLGALVGERPIAASGAVDKDGNFVCRVYFTDLTSRLDFTLTPESFVGGFSFGAMKLSGKAATEPVPQPAVVDFELKPTEKSLIRCRLFLPDPSQWDGRLWGTGNGGEAGSIDNGTMRTVINAFDQKTAVVNTDLGTSDRRGVNCPEVWNDFGWRATHLMTVEAKRRVKEHYGKAPSKCYFYGLSTGGGQGFHEAQQFPEDYDGIVSCVPALGRMTLASLGRWCYLQAHDAKGKRLFTSAQTRTLADAGLAWLNGRLPRWSEEAAKAVLAKACEMDPSLADPELSRRILAIWRGPTLADGTHLANGVAFGVDPGCMMGWSGFQWGWHPDIGPGKNWRTTDEATYLKVLRELGPILNAENPDLSAFAARGGKCIAFAGLEDHIVPFPSVVDYWERAAAAAGGEEKVGEFFRFYLIPKLRHGSDLCYSTLQDIVAWVERDKVPGDMVARENGEWATEHVVKPYPQGVERPLVVPTDPRLRTFQPRPE